VLGLYNYKARFYSTTLGRFASADTVTLDGLNRYAYVKNNPVRWNDPTGRCTPGELVILWNPCTAEKAEYVKGDNTPVTVDADKRGCSSRCYEMDQLAKVGWTVEQ
jgi:hypothetical protein